MQCQELEHVLEENGGGPLPAPAQAHLQSCGTCRTLVEELERIEEAAHQLPAEVEPPERIWISLRSHLEAEKIIKPENDSRRRSLPTAWGRVLRPAVAVAALCALVLAIVLVRLRPIQPEISATLNPAVTQPHVLMQTKNQLEGIEGAAVRSRPAPDSATGVSLWENLKIVDNFIASCEQTVNSTPQNDLAREYLSGAYQQKAELLAAIQDSNEIGDAR